MNKSTYYIQLSTLKLLQEHEEILYSSRNDSKEGVRLKSDKVEFSY
jgi:hypothetical protein